MCFTSEIWLCGFGVLVAVLLRCSTSLHPYSGKGRPPMFGDYEAQRHWMEVTVNLPVNEWYHNTTNNDLQYWGLDYPPLTAYHSYVCGWVASFINPDFVALRSSRGFESEDHKLFMRYTVLFVDLLVYVPAVIVYFMVASRLCDNVKKGAKNQQGIAMSAPLSIIVALFYPGLILIDHGHFQYNCVSLGFAVYAIAFICMHRNVLASVFFCLALNYKQMELYHALPFFVYLLSTCVPKPGQNASSGVIKFCKLAFSVLATFSVIWSPFLFNRENVLQVLHRLFPLARGVFEDKVANVWCTLNVFYKFKSAFSHHQMVQYCAIATLIAALPSSADMFLKPNVKKFIPAIINSSLAFFLFSFQVHEKSILLAAIPVMLYANIEPFACFWFSLISVFSMFPLLAKDGLILACIALTVFYAVTFHITSEYCAEKLKVPAVIHLPPYKDVVQIILDLQNSRNSSMLFRSFTKNSKTIKSLLKFLALSASLLGCGVLMLLMLIFEPPEAYPDVFPLLISAYSCVHFVGFLVYFNIVQFKIPQAVEDVRYFKHKGL